MDFNRQRLCLVAPKTETYREVPIAPRLAELLAEADKTRSVVGGLRIEDGVSVSGLSGNNLDRRAGVYCKAAGVEKWPYFFQAMRTSCENDWKAAGIPEPTYTAWAGHSATVSRRHYVSPTEEEFARVTKVA